MTDLYVQPHRSQYEPGASDITRHAGCTWTSLANGIGAISGGSKRPSPDQVHALVAHAEETSPATPGWSLPDAILAADRLPTAVTLTDHTGDGWDAAVLELLSGHYLLLQGDSDQFPGTSCSGAFDGDHCIGVHPRTKVEAGERWWWVDDPICQTARWERASVLRRYAEDLLPAVRFAAFPQPVPAVPAPKPPAQPVHLRFGARRLAKPVAKRIRVPAGRLANVRTAPRKSARVASHLANGKAFGAWQVTDKGQVLAGSGRWFGNRDGSRWTHSSSF